MIRQLFLLFVIAALAMACSTDETQDTEDVTDTGATGGGTVPMEEREYALNVVYGGGLAPEGRGETVFSATGDSVTYTTYGADGSIQKIQERTLTPAERQEMEDLIDDVGDLQPSYGDGTGAAADAGSADIAITRPGGTLRTTIDPNTEETYPDELTDLMEWVRERIAAFSDSGAAATACTDPRPENCIQIYDPVCGDNGQTYGNSCTACADANVSSYVPGEC